MKELEPHLKACIEFVNTVENISDACFKRYFDNNSDNGGNYNENNASGDSAPAPDTE